MRVGIKDRCVLCNHKIEEKFNERCLSRFWEYGNFCPVCTALCNRFRASMNEADRAFIQDKIDARQLKFYKKPRVIELEVPEHNVFQKIPKSEPKQLAFNP